MIQYLVGCLKQSKGEYLIEQYLKNKNIKYQKEYIFQNLKTDKNGFLRFDFAIFDKEQLYCLIEFDGKQHYEATDNYRFNKEYLLNIQNNDNLKNNYCKEHNLKLYRISYQQIDFINTLLEKYIKL